MLMLYSSPRDIFRAPVMHTCTRRGSGNMFVLQPELIMQGPDGQFQVFLLDYDRNLDFGCRNHPDIDRLIGQGTKHATGYARMRPHADTDQRDLGDVRIDGYVLGA